MTSDRWITQVDNQKKLLRLEEDVVLDLLEEVRELELHPGNGRDLSTERSLLKEHLAVLATERARLDVELAHLAEGPGRLEPLFRSRERPLAEQGKRVQLLLTEWRAQNAQGRRRRLRDHMWFDALLLEEARLESEQRRLAEQKRS